MSESDDLLVEIGTEELPPKALRPLMEALTAAVVAGLDDARLGHGDAKAFASPRRLAVLVSDVATSQADREVVHRGPPVSVAFDEAGDPTRAAEAFAGKRGVAIEALGREKTEAGEWLVHQDIDKGKPAAALLPGIVAAALEALPIPRRMRWGANEAEFVRPVHWFVMLHGRSVVPASVFGVEAGNRTRGHRFHAGGDIVIGKPADYERLLEERGYVIADFSKRRKKIFSQVTGEAKRAVGEAVGDPSLFDEVAALTEWPVALTGAFDSDYLELPREVIEATLTGHQRYFPVAGEDGGLLPVFVTVANLESSQPERVRDGNERVIRPRLADARFFWESDREVPLAERTDALKNVVYQQGLGSLHDKSMRVAALAKMFSEQLDVDSEAVTRAAVLAKCDLVTGMVGEFPELQGTMGEHYARASNEPAAVATAIGEHYLPRFAGDRLPETAAGQVLAVADKLDTLAGAFVLGKKPSGNRDPFGLRRAALGVIRILVEQHLDLDIGEAARAAIVQQPASGDDHGATGESLNEFIVERLKSYFLEKEPRLTADMFESVRLRQPASLVDFRERLMAVAGFITLEPAKSLAAANKRTANILRQAGDAAGDTALDSALLADDAERVLFHAVQAARQDVAPLIARRAYTEAFARLAELRVPVDAFFDDVMVMSDDASLRNNRLALLAELRSLFLDIADISRLTPARD